MAPQNSWNNGYGADGYNSEGFNRQGRYDATYDQDSSYYIDRGDTAETREQAQQDAEQTADAQEAGGSWIDNFIDILTRQGRVDEAYDQQMTAQATRLAEGVETRQPPPMMCANYMSVAHPELKTMVTEGVDPDGVGEMGDMWIQAGNAMTRFQDSVATAINNSETDWQGEAGNSARQFMANVGNWVGSAGQSAQLAGTQTNIQAEALSEAKRSMPDPVEFDAAAANQDLQTTSNPLELMNKYATYMSQYNAQQEAHQQAAQVVGTYDSGLSSASTMPAFTPPPTMSNPGDGTGDGNIDRVGELGRDQAGVNGDTGGTGNTGGSNGTGGTGGNPSVPTVPPNGTGGSGSGSGGDSGGGFGSGGGGAGGSGGGPGGTNPSGGGEFPGPGQFPLPGPNTGPGGGGGNNSNFPGGAPMPISGLGPGGTGGGDMERRGFGGGRGGFGPGGSGGGFGGSGSGGGAGGGSGSGSGSGMGGRGGVGGMGPGGMGAGALAAENAAMRGGPGGAGGRGMGPGGMMGGGMGGGRGQGEDDDEHQRPSFLVEGDPDAVFGTDEITAPPVIGE